MNKDTLQGNWKQLKGNVKEQWGKLTDDDLTQIRGNYDELVGKIQERYGTTRSEVEQQLNEWMDKVSTQSHQSS